MSRFWLLVNSRCMGRPTQCFLVLLISVSLPLFGQTQLNVDNGFKPYASFDGSHLDSINLLDSNLLLHAPLDPSHPQRGKLDPQLLLYVTSRNWTEHCDTSQTNGVPYNCYWAYGGTGVTFEFTGQLSVHREVLIDTSPQFGTSYSVNKYSLSTWDGGTHELQDLSNGDFTSMETVDGTGYHINTSNPDANGLPTVATVIDREGTQYQTVYSGARCTRAPVQPPYNPGGHPIIYDTFATGSKVCEEKLTIQKITDSNGNEITGFNSLGTPAIDTLGRQAWPVASSTTSDSTGCANTLPFSSATLMTYAGANGVTNTIKVCSGTINLATNFNVANVAEIQNNPYGYSTAFQHITTVILPDSTKWVFSYDSYGNVTNIALPQGGSISYAWANFTAPLSSACPSKPSVRTVQTRTLTDINGNTAHWNYNWGTAQANGTLTNIVTDAYGNDTVHVFSTLPVSGMTACQKSETATLYYQGSHTGGTLIKREDTSYSLAQAWENNSIANPMPTDIKTTVYPSGKIRLIHKDYDPGPQGNLSYGNVVAEKEYDWGQTAPGPLLRETDTTYQWQADTAGNYQAAHFIDLPQSVVVKDGGGCIVSKTTFGYDESPLQSSGLTSSQQLAAAPNTVRGNQTSVNKYLWTLSTGSCAAVPSQPSIVSHSTYYDSGELYQSRDPLGNTTTHNYDSAYRGAYPTGSCNALNQCVSATYDFSTGLMTSFTDANAGYQASGTTQGDPAHTTTYAYDFMSRLTTVTAPADPQGNHAQTSFSYPSPTEVDRSQTISSAVSEQSSTFYDGLGKVIKAQHTTPGGVVTVDTTYDQVGRKWKTSNPYYSTTDSTYGITQTDYDPLDRVLKVTKQDGSFSTVAYDIAPILPIAGDCTLSMDEAGKQRRGCTDALGRLVEVDETGDPFNGSHASGSFTVSGTLQSGTRATGSVTIQGSEQSKVTSSGGGGSGSGCDPSTSVCPLGDGGGSGGGSTIYDAGTVTITVNGHNDSYTYGQNDSSSTVATGLANAINADSAAFVTATASGSTVSLTTTTPGSRTNYSLSSSSSWDSNDFSGPSFTPSNSGSTLTGGGDAGNYDYGTVTVTIGTGTNAFVASASYSNSGNNTAALVASALAGTGATGLNRPGSPVQATVSGAAISLSYVAIGPGGNLPVSVSATTNSGLYNSPSFGSTGTTLSGGFNPEGPSLDFNYLVTLYAFDGLGDLTSVTQKGDPAATTPGQWRVRTFTYDSLSRLLSSNNPESGQITYSYDNAGNLISKTDARGITASYTYDALNRLTGKNFSDGTLGAAYTYDRTGVWGPNETNTVGRLVLAYDGHYAATLFSYDALGRVIEQWDCPPSAWPHGCYTVNAQYNLAGDLTKLTYPNGEVVDYTVDAAGHTTAAKNSAAGINYVSGATYGPDNALTGFVSGSGSGFSGVTSSFTYNNRLQPVNMSAGTPNQTVFSIGYDVHLGNGDNGDVFGITNYKDSGRNQTFTYDALNRLISAQTPAPTAPYTCLTATPNTGATPIPTTPGAICCRKR